MQMSPLSSSVLVLVLCPLILAENYWNVSDLYKTLLLNYNKQLPPRRNLSTPVIVKMDVYPTSVAMVDVVRESLVTNVLINFKWEDQHIQWNKTEYGELAHLRFLRSDVWTPDIVIQNSLDFVPYLGSSEQQVRILHTGQAEMTLEVKATTSCPMYVTRFPLDSHTCYVLFGSDNYYQYELHIPVFNIGRRLYTNNGEWDLRNIGKMYEAELSGWLKIDYYSMTLTLKRQPLFHILNLILPILIISTINPFVFLVKADTGEKLSISVTLFLSFTVFASILGDMLPQTSHSSSSFAVYVYAQLLFNGVYVVCSILIQRVSHMTKENWFTTFIGKYGCKRGRNIVNGSDKNEDVQGIRMAEQDASCSLRDVSYRLDRIMFVISSVVFLLHTIGTFVFISL